MIWIDVVIVGAFIYATIFAVSERRARLQLVGDLRRIKQTRFVIDTPAGPLIDVGLEYLALHAAMVPGERYVILRIADASRREAPLKSASPPGPPGMTGLDLDILFDPTATSAEIFVETR